MASKNTELLTLELKDIIRGLTDGEYRELVQEVVPSAKTRNTNKLSDRTEFIDYINSHLDLLNNVKAKLTSLDYKIPEPGQESRILKFVNRDAERAELLDQVYCAPYVIITAPAGYGKTELLRALGYGYEDQGWKHLLLTVQARTSLYNLAREISNQLALKRFMKPMKKNDPADIGRHLGTLIRDQVDFSYKDAEDKLQRKKGLVLLIDVSAKSNNKFGCAFSADAFFHKFVAGIESALKRMSEFQDQRLQFRIVIAGRYLDRWWVNGTLRPRWMPLSPFTYQYVFETVDQLWPKQSRSENEEFAAYLMHATAGHPGAMTQVIKSFENAHYPEPDIFFENVSAANWHSAMNNLLENIDNGIDFQLRDALQTLSVFRLLNYEVIDILLDPQTARLKIEGMSGPVIIWDKGSNDLADKLCATKLLNWDDEQFLIGDIVRRLFVLRLKQNSPAEFIRICQVASEIYKSLIIYTTESGRAVRWCIEMMFQIMQQYSVNINTVQNRLEARKNFFDIQVPMCIELLTKNWDLSRVGPFLYSSLADNKGRGWEFEFLVNFCFRDEKFSDVPYRDFLSLIKSLLKMN
jgi:hypothetical protein